MATVVLLARSQARDLSLPLAGASTTASGSASPLPPVTLVLVLVICQKSIQQLSTNEGNYA